MGDEGWGHLNILLTDAIQNDPSGATKAVAGVIQGQTVDDPGLEDEGASQAYSKTEHGEEKPDVYALASGNLGLISFTQWPKRMSREQIEEAFPAMIPGLAQHEGVGFVMVRSQKDGPVAIGVQGVYYLNEDRFEGENPLATFGRNAPDHLRRTDSFPNCPDILVNSFYDPETDEGCAFEELIGFHGGLGGLQTEPFLLHPAELPVGEDPLVGAEAVYRVLKGWVTELHHEGENQPQS